MSTIVSVLTTVFSGIWSLLTESTVPLLDITFAQMAIGFLVIKMSLNLIAVITGFRSNIANDATALRNSSEAANHYKKVYDEKSR